MSKNSLISDEELKLLNALVDSSDTSSITVVNEDFDVLTPENARFVAGQDLYLYIPKVKTNKRYGLAKYNPTDFTVSNDGVLSLLYSKSQIEDYFAEIRGGTREQTVVSNPAINLVNLDKTDKYIQSEVTDLYSKDGEIYGSSGRDGTVLSGIDLTTLNTRDNTLQSNIDYIIQDNRSSESTDSTYSASKITQLIKEAKMEGLHFVGYIGKSVGVDDDGSAIIKDGALWHVSNDISKPIIDGSWSAETMYICTNGEWVSSGEYIPSDFDIWKNVDLPDTEINTWWFFDQDFEVLDFNVDMSLYYTKVQSDNRFKSLFTYGNYLSEVNTVLTIDNLNMPTTGKLTSYNNKSSNLTALNVEDAIKELEDYTQSELDEINARPFWLNFVDKPTREGEYTVTTNGVYRSYKTDNGYEWRLVTTDLDTLLPRVNANTNVANGLEFSIDNDTGYFLSSLKLINLNTENESSKPISVPVASLDNDGIMPATAMRALQDLDVRVNALEGGTRSYFVDFGSDSPSQSALDLIYKSASGDTNPPMDLTRLIDNERNIYFEYYNGIDIHWQGPYTYRYNVASNEQLGLVLSSEQKGQIFVEPVTGIMSLNGYTDIINTFNTLYGGTDRSSIDVSQVPEIPATKITSGTLNSARLPIVPVSKGGTNNNTFSAYKLVVTGDVDETDSTANKLMDGPSFGALNTLLVGQGANEIPIFKSRDDIGLELVSRKITTWGTPTDVQYPSALLVKKSIDKKVDKVDGKGLSTNDYDNTEKSNVAGNTSARHTHSNKELLDTYNQTNANIKDAVDKKHSHSNKELLDTYKQTEANLADAVSKKHNHSNKSLLDTYTQTETNLADAVSKKHSHSNKSVLDNTTASYTTEEKTKLSGIASGAEVNVQPDWNVTDKTSDAYIKNKPIIPDGAKLYSTTGQNTDGAMTQKAATDEFDKKVDKVKDKGLSTNDFTNDYKSQVDSNTSARHTHSNKSVLDNITASYTTEEKEKLQGIEAEANKTTSVDGLTGGNIKGTSGDKPLTVQSASQSTFIGFKNSSGSALGYLGVNNNKRPIFYDSIERELALKNDIPNVSQSTGTSTTDVMSQKATTDSLNGKIDWSAIKQSTGTGENVVMSQKAITDELTAILTALSNKFTNHPISTYDCNTCYDEGLYPVENGSNCPTGARYGSLFVMPHIKFTGNTNPDFAVQIFIPNGDNSTKANSMFYRTSLRSSWNDWQEVATTDELNAITTALSNKFTNHPQSAYNCNTCYDEGVYLIANGSNCPSGSQYGSLFVMPYRKPTGNTKPDFAVQIYLPNGDDSTHPNSMFYRTSLADSWNSWKTSDDINSWGWDGSNGSKGYIRFSNGFQIVWGRVYNKNTTYSYAMPFKDSSSYSVAGVSQGWTGSYGNYGMGNLTESGFYLNSDKDYTWNYIAVGFWK